MELPNFKYHPNPIETGSILKSDEKCQCCNVSKGYIYCGSFYSKHPVREFCPWCIANGEAAEKFDGSFIASLESEFFISNLSNEKISLLEKVMALFSNKPKYPNNDLPQESDLELFCKTPGFSSYQEEVWLEHCGKPCEYHGLAVTEDLQGISQEEIERLVNHSSMTLDDIKELAALPPKTKLDNLFKFKCINCNELRFWEDLD